MFAGCQFEQCILVVSLSNVFWFLVWTEISAGCQFE